MSGSLQELEARRHALVQRSRTQRSALASQGRELVPWVKAADWGFRAALFIRARPGIAIAVVFAFGWIARRGGLRVLPALTAAVSLAARLAAARDGLRALSAAARAPTPGDIEDAARVQRRAGQRRFR